MGFAFRPWLKHGSRGAAALAVAALALTAGVVGGSGVAEASPAATAQGAPPACTDTFTSTSGGDWFTGSNWSLGHPPSPSDVACINQAGTYTVTMNGAGTQVGTLLLGGASGSQTLSIGSTCSFNAVFSTTNGITISAAGVLILTNGDGCGNNVTINGGDISSAGTILTVVPGGGARTIQSNLTNTGTIAVNLSLSYTGSGTTLDNKGAVNVADGMVLAVSNGASFTNDSGGSISASGSLASGLVSLSGAGTFTQGNGTTAGAAPVIVDDATLSYSGSGASVLRLRGNSALSGSLAAGQTLQLESTCSEHAVVTAAGSFTNAGTLILTNGDGCGNNATLVVSNGGTLTNSGAMQVPAPGGGARTIQSNLTNTGTVTINQPTSYNAGGTTFDNQGTVTIANGVTFTVSNGAAFTNDTTGKVNASSSSGSGELFATGATFTEKNGTTLGVNPVVVDDSTLVYSGSGTPGASLIRVRGSSALSGDVLPNQTLQLESTCSEHAVVTAAGSFTNAGTLILTNGDGCGNNATLVVSNGGTLTNSGAIQSLPANGGQRTLQGNLTNTGTVTINQPTGYSGTLLNQGTITLADGVGLTVTGTSSVTNTSTGKINASSSSGSGDLFLAGGTTFVEAGGTTLGVNPVIVDDATPSYTGTRATGPSLIRVRGSSALSGNVLPKQTLQLESTCSEHAVVTAAGSFTNAGTLILTNGDGCGNNATLNLNGGTLTNNGTVQTLRASGGQRIIQGNVSNARVVNLGDGITLQVQGNYTQASTGVLATNITPSGTGVISVSGSATLAGNAQVIRPNSFVPSVGTSFGILSAGAASGTFAQVLKAVITPSAATYFQPRYSPTAFSLVVAQATATVPASATRGQTISVSGSGWTPNETVTVIFRDHAGVLTTLAPITVDSSGSFTANETIPAGAALGQGGFRFTSTVTGVAVTKLITITTGPSAPAHHGVG